MSLERMFWTCLQTSVVVFIWLCFIDRLVSSEFGNGDAKNGEDMLRQSDICPMVLVKTEKTIVHVIPYT